MYGITPKKGTVRDFARFGAAMLESGDIDPQFWILRRYYTRHGISRNTALWMSLVYLVFYHLGSASVAWKMLPEPEEVKDWDPTLAFYKQRRCFRGNPYNGRLHLNAVIHETGGDLEGWMDDVIGDGGRQGWQRLREEYSMLPYSGPWSSYKWCDMMKFIHRAPITAPDIGNKPGETAGPIAGLSTLTGLSRDECARDPRIYRYLYRFMKEEMGVPLIGVDHLESCLCDWQSVANGRYYHGHDVDRDLQQLLSVSPNEVTREFFEIRREVFDARLLGEVGDGLFNSWSGIRHDLKGRYRAAGEIVNVPENVKKVRLL